MIKLVTMTGADDSVMPERIFETSDKFPFVEWAILVSRTSAGTPRFPSLRWIDKVAELNNERIIGGKPSINLSCHLCGKYVRELLIGNGEFITEELDDVWNIFSRVQINTHAEPHDIDAFYLTSLLNMHNDKEFIFQYDGVNGETLLNLQFIPPTHYSTLFDLSHGAGLLPESWPALLPGIKCGYAGGIGPDNIEQQIIKINEIVGDVDTWVDMETKVRSANNQQFDIMKVEQCLRIAEPYIK